ncbi:MAG: hypothetical protein WKF75_12050 [Singulisphaera sp.]
MRIGVGGGGTQGHFRGAIDDVRIYDVALTDDEIETIATPEPITAIVDLPPEERTELQARKLRMYHLDQVAPLPFREARDRVLELRRSRKSFGRVSTTMVMQEMATPRHSSWPRPV